jgi:hypothetical protein
MSTLASNAIEALAVDVRCDAQMMHVRLLDGRELSVPLEWFPKLRDATASQRKKWRLIGRGVGIHWEVLDEDLSVAGLLQGNPPCGSTG